MDIISTSLMGGLGNMMFQISTAFNISQRDKKNLICDTRNMQVPHKPYSEYTNNIFRKIIFSDFIPNQKLYREPHFEYSEIPKIDGNVKLIGYFQTEKYFLEYRKEILELFEIDNESKFFLNEKYNEILNKDLCSIHVRRGDYLKLQTHHPVQSIDYYKNAVKLIGEDKHFLVFSDDIDWCKQNLDFISDKTFVSNNLDYQDLYLMSICKNNIIANSSFSWWGAWMNRDENKKVIIPNKWFGDAYSSMNTNDIYCQNWIKL